MTTIFPLTLPYTKPPLSLNDRGQTPGARARDSATAAQIKSDVARLARAARIGRHEAIHVRLNYRPKDRRRRDADNLVATLKPCLDGLVAAGVIPDDTPAHLDWSAPRIHEPAEDRKPLLWLTITVAACSICGDPLAERANCPDRHGWEDHGLCCVGACQVCRGEIEDDYEGER